MSAKQRIIPSQIGFTVGSVSKLILSCGVAAENGAIFHFEEENSWMGHKCSSVKFPVFKIKKSYYVRVKVFKSKVNFDVRSTDHSIPEVLAADAEEVVDNPGSQLQGQQPGSSKDGPLDELVKQGEKDALPGQRRFEPYGKKWYWIGPEIGADFKSNRAYEPGSYYIKVYNETNTGNYVLATGDIEKFGPLVIAKLPIIMPKVNKFWDTKHCTK